MRLLLSAPSGFNTRELLLPLSQLLDTDPAVTEIVVLTPAAELRNQLFPSFSSKYQFIANPATEEQHRALLSNLAPDVVLTPTFGLDDKDTPILRAAKALDIPTVTFVASWDNVYKMERFKTFGKTYQLADYFAVWNQMMRDHLLRVFPEVPPERVVITGPLRFDFFSHLDRIPSKEALLAYIGLANDDSALIHCATTELYPFEYIIRAMYSAVQRRRISRPLQFFASVHPGGNMSKHENYKKHGAAVQYSFGRRPEIPLKEFQYLPTFEQIYLHVALFKYAAILVNQSSTVAIESMLADVPVINVKYGRRFDWWRWRRSMVYRDFQQHYADIVSGGGTTIAATPRELIAAVNKYLEDPSYKRAERTATIKKMITCTDGSSSRQLLDYLKDICAA